MGEGQGGGARGQEEAIRFRLSWPGLTRPSRLDERRAFRNGITGTNPVMTNDSVAPLSAAYTLTPDPSPIREMGGAQRVRLRSSRLHLAGRFLGGGRDALKVFV